MRKFFLLVSLVGMCSTLAAREVREITVDNRTRTYTFYFPEDRTTQEETQLLVMLHGLGGSPDSMLPPSIAQQMANEQHCAIMLPAALKEQDEEIQAVVSMAQMVNDQIAAFADAAVWGAGASININDPLLIELLGENALIFNRVLAQVAPEIAKSGKAEFNANVDDVKFINAAIDDISNTYTLKPNVWISGLSLGGAMTYKYLFSGQSRAVKAVILSGFVGKSVTIPQTIGIPCMIVHSQSDDIVTYEGGIFNNGVESTVVTIATAQGHNLTDFATTTLGEGETATTVKDYAASPRLLFYSIGQANHVLDNVQGYDVYEHLWDFLNGTEDDVQELVAQQTNFRLYPNPAGDEAYCTEEGEYTISDLSGRVLRQGETEEGYINLIGLARGRYLFTLKNDKSVYNILLLKR